MPEPVSPVLRLLDYSGNGQTRKYVAKGVPVEGRELIRRQRAAHAEKLRGDLREVQSAAQVLKLSEELSQYEQDAGIHLEIKGKPGEDLLLEPLDSPRFGITLENVRFEESTAVSGPSSITTVATVFVKEGKLSYLASRVEAYATSKTRTEKDGKVVKIDSERFVTSIESIGLAAVEALWTSRHPLPEPSVDTWWEVWVRAGVSAIERSRHEEAFLAEATRHGMNLKEGKLVLPEHTIFLLKTTRAKLASAVALLNFVSELRYPALTPAFFMEETPSDQQEWAANLRDRLNAPPPDAPAVCILDTGVNRGHPLIDPILAEQDHDTVREAWGRDDHHQHGHGTAMSGLAAFGDLTPLLQSADPIQLTHRLESVKILPRFGTNEPEHYGPITQEAVARAEINAPRRQRVFSLSVTATDAADFRETGKPSAWSSAVDSLASGSMENELIKRLVCVSGGNIFFENPALYPNRNELTSLEDPAQSWNALTIGACTDKVTITDANGDIPAGFSPVAAQGGLCPTSATSCLWTGKNSSNWPLKPDLVLEGGNQASDATGFVSKFDSLSLLTTNANIQSRLFTTFGDTSAATALAARMAAILQATYPRLWPETVRALLIHSADWSPEMVRGVDLTSKLKVAHVLRRFGHGKPDLARALSCAKNRTTLLCQDALQPFEKEKGKSVATKHMMMYRFPWPKNLLQQHGDAQVRLRATLSYFIEPNPGSRLGDNKYRYAGCSLRFLVQTATETITNFTSRVTQAVSEADKLAYEKPDDTTDGWLIGDQLRSRGSVHSDTWTGTAAKLAQMEHLAVFPVNGWWRLRPQLKRFDQPIRYSLVVTLEAAGVDIDLYTPISNTVALLT